LAISGYLLRKSLIISTKRLVIKIGTQLVVQPLALP
jgi:hypothetical protein